MEQQTQKTFHFFAPIIKSSSKSDDADVIDFIVYGAISSGKKDFDGHTIPTNILDTSYFEKSGRIKVEHTKDHTFFVGAPEAAFKIGNSTEFVGRIFAKKGTPQYNVAKGLQGDIINLEEFNKRYPNNPRHIGYSIEGYGVHDKNGKFLKAVVTDVAITPHPKNDDSYLKAIIKGFSIGYETNPNNMSGGAAGRIQSLQGDKSFNLTKIFTMEFANKKACKDFLISKGFTEDLAEQKATEWESTQTKKNERNEKFKKSITTLEKGIKSVTDFIEDNSGEDDEPPKQVVDLKKSLKTAYKGVKNDKDEYEVQMTDILKAHANSNVDLVETVINQNTDIARFVGMNMVAVKEALEFNKSLLDTIEDVALKIDIANEETSMLAQKVANFEKGVTTAGLGNLPIINGAGSDEDKEAKAVPPALINAAFSKAIGSSDYASMKEHLQSCRTAFETHYNKSFGILSEDIKPIIKGFLPDEFKNAEKLK